MSRFRAEPYRDQSEINLSSMLDVVFILLIFFIVMATFIDETGLPVDVPEKLTEVSSETANISVIVAPDGVFRVNDRVLARASVAAYVRALHAENPDAAFTVLLEPGSVVRDAAVAIEAGRHIGVDVVPVSALD